MKSIKKTLCLLVTMLLLVSTITPVMANGDIKVKIDGQQIAFDVPPQLINDRTMVPLRAIFEALGATVLWDGETRTVTAYNEAYYVKATIDKQDMYVNGEARQMDIAPMIVEGRTLVPARFVAEAFNCQVDWDGTNKTVSISSREIDYNSLEKTTEIEKKPNEKEEEENLTTYGKYYPGTNIPDYTAVTGIELKDFYEGTNAITYIYPDTKSGKYSEVVDYMGYLRENCGWSSYKTEDKIGHISWYYVKGPDLISVSYYSEYDEIWITFGN